MPITASQELEDEFPRDARVLSLLKLADAQFCNLAERYHALGRAIQRIESEVESASDLYLARLRKQRLALLDEIGVIVEEAEERFTTDCVADVNGAEMPLRSTPTPAAAGLFGRAEPVPA